MKRSIRVLCAAFALTLLAACGTPALPATTPAPTLVLPTRVPIQPTVGAKETTAPAAAEPTKVPPTAAPTIQKTAAPTLIPSKAPATATVNAVPPTPTVNPAVARGEDLFKNGIADEAVPKCTSCHYVDKNEPFTGPSQIGIGKRAGSRVAGQDAATYIRNSILNPNIFLVPNEKSPDGIEHVYSAAGRSLMYQDYAKHLTTQQVNDVVAYLLTLK